MVSGWIPESGLENIEFNFRYGKPKTFRAEGADTLLISKIHYVKHRVEGRRVD